MNELTVRLRLAYRHSGLTLKQIACRAGLHENTVIAVIQGRGNPRLDTLVAICAVLGVSSLPVGAQQPNTQHLVAHERT